MKKMKKMGYNRKRHLKYIADIVENYKLLYIGRVIDSTFFTKDDVVMVFQSLHDSTRFAVLLEGDFTDDSYCDYWYVAADEIEKIDESEFPEYFI